MEVLEHLQQNGTLRITALRRGSLRADDGSDESRDFAGAARIFAKLVVSQIHSHQAFFRGTRLCCLGIDLSLYRLT